MTNTSDSINSQTVEQKLEEISNKLAEITKIKTEAHGYYGLLKTEIEPAEEGKYKLRFSSVDNPHSNPNAPIFISGAVFASGILHGKKQNSIILCDDGALLGSATDLAMAMNHTIQAFAGEKVDLGSELAQQRR